MDRVTLGEKYVDSVTGYIGMATSRNENFRGVTTVRMERLDGNGKIEEVWLPEARLQEPNGPPKEVGFG